MASGGKILLFTAPNSNANIIFIFAIWQGVYLSASDMLEKASTTA